MIGILVLVLLQLMASVLANPFHKYPYVFLLDVGNEELEKVNTEQIRISKQGGSLALRYPAIGNGEDIAHVRVSGIDFGTDLKANIVDGGPGYKYVVLVLMGNPGVAFDAVITVQTVPSWNSDESSIQGIEDNSSIDKEQVFQINDANDSAEDLNDSVESDAASHVSFTKENAELTQESSNVYSYAVNEALSGYGNSVHPNGNNKKEVSDSYDNNYSYNDNDADENYDEQRDIHIPIRKNDIQVDEDSEEGLEDNINHSESFNENEPQEVQHISNDYSTMDDDQNYASDYGNQEEINSKSYKEYQAFKQNLYDTGPLSQVGEQYSSGTVYIEEPGVNEGVLNLEEILGDEYDDDDNRKYSKSNKNNFIDGNDESAISY